VIPLGGATQALSFTLPDTVGNLVEFSRQRFVADAVGNLVALQAPRRCLLWAISWRCRPRVVAGTLDNLVAFLAPGGGNRGQYRGAARVLTGPSAPAGGRLAATAGGGRDGGWRGRLGSSAPLLRGREPNGHRRDRERRASARVLVRVTAATRVLSEHHSAQRQRRPFRRMADAAASGEADGPKPNRQQRRLSEGWTRGSTWACTDCPFKDNYAHK